MSSWSQEPPLSLPSDNRRLWSRRPCPGFGRGLQGQARLRGGPTSYSSHQVPLTTGTSTPQLSRGSSVATCLRPVRTQPGLVTRLITKKTLRERIGSSAKGQAKHCHGTQQFLPEVDTPKNQRQQPKHPRSTQAHSSTGHRDGRGKRPSGPQQTRGHIQGGPSAGRNTTQPRRGRELRQATAWRSWEQPATGGGQSQGPHGL